jgi:hypothetical protein
MNSASLFLIIEKPGEETISLTIHRLENAGLRVMRTFDLREARLSHPDCPCPHHGTETCDCQMSVLLIYHQDQSPATLLIHSFQETTWLYIVGTPEQPVQHNLDVLIRDLLAVPVPNVLENRHEPGEKSNSYEIH